MYSIFIGPLNRADVPSSRSLTPVSIGMISNGSRASLQVRNVFPHTSHRSSQELVPLILKGVQCWEDAMEAYDHGLAGVVLSNHGGRQLDFSRSGIEILAEVVENLSKKRNLTFPNEKFQLFIDGGVRRATDVLKAVALGATAVGIGRPFIYAYSAYGQEGVDKALQILHVSVSLHGRRKGYSILEQDEFEMNLRLLGAPTLKNVVPEMVDTSNLSSHIVSVPDDRLYVSNCEYSLSTSAA